MPSFVSFLALLLQLLAQANGDQDAACGACDRTLTLALTTDEYGMETTFALEPAARDPTCSHDAVASGGPFEDLRSHSITVSSVLCAERAYNFTVFDSGNDGVST